MRAYEYTNICIERGSMGLSISTMQALAHVLVVFSLGG